MKESIEQINDYIIEAVALDEWEEYKNLWLEAVTTDPQAFGYSFAEISNRLESEWKNIIISNLNQDNSCKIIAAKNSDKIMAMAGYFTVDNTTAYVYGVYTGKDYRGKGFGHKVLQALLDAVVANPKFKQVELGVNISQKPAIELYKKLGFEVVGVDKDVKMGDGRLYDEFLMRKQIK